MLAPRVRVPAITLIAVASIGTLLHAWQIGVVGFGLVRIDQQVDAARDMSDTLDVAFDLMFGAALLPLDILSLLTGGLIILGGWQMATLRNRPLAITASIIAIIPCFSPCFCLGLPIGIWSLVVLCDEDVKRSFT